MKTPGQIADGIVKHFDAGNIGPCSELDRQAIYDAAFSAAKEALRQVNLSAASEGFDAAIASMRHPDGSAVEIVSVVNPFRAALDATAGYTTRPSANSTVIRFGPPKNETTVKVARMEAERRMAEHRERVGITVQEQQWFIEGFMQGVRWQ